ncbi:MAG: CvpA family protein [Alphaproteobacteria bacterium]|nr:CvpA family protein [Alphaproteobacteria bacterium]
MNNLDIFIVVVFLLSGLISLNRGLIKEVLSIMGWIFSIITIVFLLPIVKPLVNESVQNETMSSIISSIGILIVFFIFWFIITSRIVGKIRSSKLSSLDRILGLFFGIVRAALLLILFNIFVGWIITPEEQPEVFKKSKYFQLAGDFAEPIEKLLPKKAEKTEKTEEQNDEKKESVMSEDMGQLFDKLVQPKVENPAAKPTSSSEPKKQPEQGGYNSNEQQNLDRLIEITIEE